MTGFGPFPGVSENPTERLARELSRQPAQKFGADTLRAIVLSTDYQKSWAVLRRLYGRFAPDVVVHFGLSRKAHSIHVERGAHRACDPARSDAAGFAPASGVIRRAGPEALPSTLPADAIASVLEQAGFPAGASDHAGRYVCNATFYRSLGAAPAGRMVGFIHVPPEGQGGFDAARLLQAGELVVVSACRLWRGAASPTC